jgi:hypothetical protein
MVKRQATGITKTQFIYINQLVVSDLAQISRMTADPHLSSGLFITVVSEREHTKRNWFLHKVP